MASETSLDALFGALANGRRRAIVARLAGGRATTPQIGRRFRLTRQALNRHVALLERAGVVTRTLRGREHEVELVPARLDEVTDFVAQLRRGWSASLDRLGEVLRESRK